MTKIIIKGRLPQLFISTHDNQLLIQLLLALIDKGLNNSQVIFHKSLHCFLKNHMNVV